VAASHPLAALEDALMRPPAAFTCFRARFHSASAKRRAPYRRRFIDTTEPAATLIVSVSVRIEASRMAPRSQNTERATRMPSSRLRLPSARLHPQVTKQTDSK
jgi:hypothetical protein